MELLFKIFLSLTLLCFSSLSLYVYNILWLRPERLRSKLRKQGIKGPKPSFLVGNIPDMKKIKLSYKPPNNQNQLVHDYASAIFPYFEQWRKQYGRNFMFSLGNIQLLYVTDPYMAKEISLCTSLDLGKPAYQQKERGALLGQGILTSNGSMWIHQRKTIAPELYMDKVKGTVNLMVESASKLIRTWETKIASVGEPAEIRVDEDLRNFSSYIISKVLFGSSYSKGLDIFLTLRALQKALSTPSLLNGVPGLRHVPTKKNRELWKLEKEANSMILKIVKERRQASKEKDLLQMIIQGAHSGALGPDATDEFVVDNCKNIYLAGYETTAISALWGLMLLAAHPEWQARARAEVVEVCDGRLPDADMLRKMKTLTMVIQEMMRLYPPAAFVSREALEEMKFGDVIIPKGVGVWISVLTLHMDPEIWGADADKFNPERFANGILGACKIPQSYIPFGVGPRMCAGLNFAMVELKVVLALILSNFAFTLSPTYRHSPSFRLVTEPEHGVNLLVSRV